MAFTIKQFNDLRGILFLMLMTIPSIATTNIDCNGKPFQCVNSTHFMICVDLGSGVSSTIDSFIIPCPAPTECHNTNRFECEFPAATTQQPTIEPVVTTTDQTTIATVQANESVVQFLSDTTTVPFEDLYNTVSTTTLSGGELSTPNPIFVADSTTIDVFNNVSTSGSHAHLEVGGNNTEVLNITSPTPDTTVSQSQTDFSVASTTDDVIIFTQTESNINTISKITTVNVDVGITTTEENKFPTFITTERVNLVTENKTETDLNYMSEKPLVAENINIPSTVQNDGTYTTESLRNVPQVENNDASITKKSIEKSSIASDQDQLRTDTAKEITVNVTNPIENKVLNTENVTTMLTDVPNDHTGAVTEQTTQIYVTTETLIASSKIPSVPTDTTIPVESNTFIENKVLVDQDKSLLSVDRGTIEKTPRLIPKTNIEISTQDTTADLNLGNAAAAVTNGSDVITGPSSEFHNAVISSTIPTIDTTLVAETTITQDAFHSIKFTSGIPTSQSNSTTEIVITNNNNLIDNITTISLLSTDSPISIKYEPTPPTATSIDTILIADTTITQNDLYSNKTTSETSGSEANVMTDIVITYDKNYNIDDNITTVSIPSTDSPTLSTDEKIGSTQKKLEFLPTVTKPAISESNINFEPNVVTQASKWDPALQQLEVSNKPDSDTNASNLNSQHNVLSNIDLNTNKQDIKTESIITEPTFIETQRNSDNNEVGTRFPLLEHSTNVPQPKNEKPKLKTIHTTESSNEFASGSKIIFEPSLLPLLPTESLYLETQTTTKGQVIIETTAAGDNQLKTQNSNIIDLITSSGSSILATEATAPYYDVTESIGKGDQLYTVSETNTITDTVNTKTLDLNFGEIMSGLRKTESIGHERPSTSQNEQTQGIVETINYSPIVAAEGKQISTESTILQNVKYNIKSMVVDTAPYESPSTLATPESILELNPTVTDSPVSESNFVFQSSVNVQLPKALATKSIDIIKINNLNAPEIDLEKNNKVEAKGHKTQMEPTGHEIPSTAQNEQTKTQMQGNEETINSSPTISVDGKQISTESIIFENEQYNIKSTVVDTTPSENQSTLATTESISELNPTVKSIDIINIHIINAPEITPMEPTGHQILSTAQNDETKTQLQGKAQTILSSPTIAADGKQISTESTISKNEQYNTIVLDTMRSENRLTLATTEINSKLYPSVTDSAVSENNLVFQSSVNVQLPKGLATIPIDIINNHNLNAPAISSENLNNVKAKGYKTPIAPITETQTQLREIVNPISYTQQQKEPKTILSIEHNIAEYDTISKLSVTESTRNFVEHNVPNLTISPDTILQSTTSVKNTEPKDFNSMDSTKSVIENNPDFIKIKNDNIKYSTGDLTTLSTTTISTSENRDDKVQDHAFQATASPQNLIVIPAVKSLETMQYSQNIKSSEGLTTKQTPIEQITTTKIGSKNNIANINEYSQNKAPTNKNTEVNIIDELVPKKSYNKPNNQEISVPILEKAVIYSSLSSTPEKQEIVPGGLHVVKHNTAYDTINYEVQQAALSESVNNNKNVIMERTNNGVSLPELSSIGDFSIQNKYTDKHLIIKQKDPYEKENIPKELNNAVVNEGKSTNTDITNHTSTSYNNTYRKFIPAQSVRGNELLNNSFGEYNNKTSNDNSSNLVKFNKSDTALVTKNINQNFTVGKYIILSKAEIQTRNESGSVELAKTTPTQSSNIIKIVPVTTNKAFTPDPNIFKNEKDQALNSEAVLSVTETLKSPQTVSSDNNVSQVSKTGAENIHFSIISSKDGYQKNVKIAPEASLAERDVLTTSNKLSTIEVISSNSQKANNNAGEALNLATFDLLSSAVSGGFEEKNSKPLTEKPDDEETITSGNEGQNNKMNKDSSFTTVSSENLSATTESVEVDNNGNKNNNIVQSNSKYETLTSKPTIEISTRPKQVDNLKNIQLPFVPEVSTQSTVRSTSQKLSLENITPLPATTKAVTNGFICKFNQRGRFADIHDCRKFYICHGIPQPLEGICPVYTVFSELRKQCTKNLSHCVRNNQFQCVSEGRFSDFLSDSIYYICARNKLSTFIRFKLRCQNGYHLNKTSVRCVLNTQSSQSISSDISKSNSEQSAALKVEVKSKDSSTKKLECKEEGKFADPDNCRVYYVCKKKSKSGYLRKKKKCDSDEYFHKDKKKCVDAESYECK